MKSPLRKKDVVDEAMQRMSESGTSSPTTLSRRTSISGLQRVNLAEQVRKVLPSASGTEQLHEEDSPRPSNRQSLSAMELAQRQSTAFARHSMSRTTGEEVDLMLDEPRTSSSDARGEGLKIRYSFLRREAEERPSLPSKQTLRLSTLATGNSFNRDRSSVSGEGPHSPRGSLGDGRASISGGSFSPTIEATKAVTDQRRGVLNASKPSRPSLMGGTVDR